jgi:hypothetical protein
MKKLHLIHFLTLIAFVGLSGCDSGVSSDHEDEVVVEAYLVANEAAPTVWLSRSIALGSTFNAQEAALSGATVVVHEKNEAGATVRSIPYLESADEPGAYVPTTTEVIRGGATYRLEVDAGAEYGMVTAETTVPANFELIAPSTEEIAYKDPEQYSMLVTRDDSPGAQNVFVFTMEAQDPTIYNLIPAYFEFIFDEDIEDIDSVEWTLEDFEDILVYSSPPISEGNYEVFEDGTLRVKLPWFAVAFYGPLKVTMTMLDSNLFDFQRYQQVQQGGSTLSPGEIPNVLDHIENGRGLFASTARVSHTVNIVRGGF